MKAKFQNITVTREFLDQNQNSYFVYSDNGQRIVTPEDAQFRGHPRAIGFVTRKMGHTAPSAFFRPEEYVKPFFTQLTQLVEHIQSHPSHTFYIPKLGYAVDNYYYIWEKIIGHNLIEDLKNFDNVVFCWDEEAPPQEITSSLCPENDKDKIIAELEQKLAEAYAIIDSQSEQLAKSMHELENSIDSSDCVMKYYSRYDDCDTP
jgi:hypothetical protein